MRRLLLIVPCLTLILAAGLPDARWILALLGCAAMGLLWLLSERERRYENLDERQAMADFIRSSLFEQSLPHLEDSSPMKPNLKSDQE